MKRLLPSFNGGVISPLVAGRVDLENLTRCLRIGDNFIPGVTGGLFRRPPLLHIATITEGSRLIPFNVSIGSNYQLEIGPGFIRVWDVVSRTTVTSLVAPWTTDLDRIQFVQSNDVMFFSHPDVIPHELRREPLEWILEPIPWRWPALRDENVDDITITPSGITGVITLTASAPLFDPLHVGSRWAIGHFRDSHSTELLIPILPPDSALLTLTGTPVADETVTIGGVNYVWKAATNVSGAYHVEIATGVTATADSCTNLINAINASGEGFGLGTAQHPEVEAESGGETQTNTSATGRLASDGSNNLVNSNITVGTITYRIEDTDLGVVGLVYDVKRGGTVAETMSNIAKAVNLTGIAGTDYATGTAINTDASAAADATGVNFTAKTSGTAGNSVATTEAFTSHLSFGAATLTGGTATPACKVKVFARQQGDLDPAIKVSETMTAGAWNMGELTGGKFVDDETSPEIIVKGRWEFNSYGRWDGTVLIERQNAAGLWDIVRSFTGRMGNENRTASGFESNPVAMRLRVENMSGLPSGGTDANPDIPQPRFLLESLDSEVFGLVDIIGYTSSTVVTGEVLTDLYSTDATALWAEGAWSDYRGYPAAVTLHENRLVFAGNASEPQKIRASQSDDFRNFEETVDASGAWSYQISAQRSNPILWLASQGKLIVGTQAEEWPLDGGDTGITPLNPPAVLQRTENSSSPVQPFIVGSVVLFVSRGGRVLEYVFDQAEQNYTAPDLTQLSEHLTLSGIRGLTYAQTPWPMLFAVTGDGQLLVCTYARKEQVVAWAPLPTDGTVESVSVSYGETAASDEVWITVTRDGSPRLERFDADHWARLRAGGRLWHTDAATVTASSGTTVTGLTHLAGKAVQVLVDGWEIPERNVSAAGVLTLPYAGDEVCVGLPAEATFQPVLFDVPLESGTAHSHKWKTSKLAVRFYNSRGCLHYDAPDAREYEVPFRDSIQVADDPPPLFTGLKKIQCDSSFRDGVETVLKSLSLHPLNILTVVPSFMIYGDA